MTIRWGITGLGDWATEAVAPAIIRASNSKLVAVSDITMEVAERFRSKFNAEKAYDSLAKMLEDADLDAIYVCTPHGLHHLHTMQVAEAGKHVICEKPMALTVADAQRMIEICNKNKVKLGVPRQYAYHPAHVEARRYIQSGTAGEIFVARSEFCKRSRARGLFEGWRNEPSMGGAGALYGAAVHPIDLLRFLLDSEIIEVRAFTDEEPPKYPVDDMVYVICRFDNGVTATVTSGLLAPRADSDTVIYGSKAKITCKGSGELLVEGDNLNASVNFKMDNPAIFSMTTNIEAFIKSIQEDREPSLSSYNGLQMVKIATAIIESSRQGKAIQIQNS